MTGILTYAADGVGQLALLGARQVGRINRRDWDAKLRASWISFLPIGNSGLRMPQPQPVTAVERAKVELEACVSEWLDAAGLGERAYAPEVTLEMCAAYLSATRLAPKVAADWMAYLKRDLGTPNECSFVVGLRAALALARGVAFEPPKHRPHNCFDGPGKHL